MLLVSHPCNTVNTQDWVDMSTECQQSVWSPPCLFPVTCRTFSIIFLEGFLAHVFLYSQLKYCCTFITSSYHVRHFRVCREIAWFRSDDASSAHKTHVQCLLGTQKTSIAPHYLPNKVQAPSFKT